MKHELKLCEVQTSHYPTPSVHSDVIVITNDKQTWSESGSSNKRKSSIFSISEKDKTAKCLFNVFLIPRQGLLELWISLHFNAVTQKKLWRVSRSVFFNSCNVETLRASRVNEGTYFRAMVLTSRSTYAYCRWHLYQHVWVNWPQWMIVCPLFHLKSICFGVISPQPSLLIGDMTVSKINRGHFFPWREHDW